MGKMLMFDNSKLEQESSGTTYYRLDKNLKEFIGLCLEKHDIIGITYDTEEPYNFGFILGDKKVPPQT